MILRISVNDNVPNPSMTNDKLGDDGTGMTTKNGYGLG